MANSDEIYFIVLSRLVRGFRVRGVKVMRSKMLPAALLAISILIIMLLSLPAPARGITYDPFDVPPGGPWFFELSDFDEKGDQMELQVVFKLTGNGSFQERPIDIVVMEFSKVRRNPSLEAARTDAIFIEEDVETRLEVMIENTKNARMSIGFYNEQQEGDLNDWDNATVKIREDYEVFNAEKSESNVVLVIILVLLILITIALVIGIGFYFLKRK